MLQLGRLHSSQLTEHPIFFFFFFWSFRKKDHTKRRQRPHMGSFSYGVSTCSQINFTSFLVLPSSVRFTIPALQIPFHISELGKRKISTLFLP